MERKQGLRVLGITVIALLAVVCGAASGAHPAAAAEPPAPPVVCDGDGVSGNRVQVVYTFLTVNRFTQQERFLRDVAVEADRMYNDSAHKTGGERHVRYVHNAACQLTVMQVQRPASADNDLGAWIDSTLGPEYKRPDRVYLLILDQNEGCWGVSWGGNGSRYSAVSGGCVGAPLATHELTHSLTGAANDGSRSPHATDNGHCWDDIDVMCYDDDFDPTTFPLRMVCPQGWQLLDCGGDDYYSTDPPSGSWLANHPEANAANSSFLIKNRYQATGGPMEGRAYALTSNGTSPDDFDAKRVQPVPGSSSNGAATELGPDSGTVSRWRLQRGESWNWQLVNAVNGECLTLAGTADRTPVTQASCTGSRGQYWTLNSYGYGRYAIQAAYDGRVLTVDGDLNVYDARIVGTPYTASFAQQWLFTEVG